MKVEGKNIAEISDKPQGEALTDAPAATPAGASASGTSGSPLGAPTGPPSGPPGAPPGPPPKIREVKNGTAVIIIVILSSFITSFAGSALNVSIPVIGLQFGSPTALLGWIVSVYTISIAVLLIPIGRLADLTSRAILLIIGIIIFSISNTLTIFADSTEYIIALRLLTGIGGAFMFSTQTAIIAETFPPQVRGKMIGISVSAIYAGLSLGPVIGGILTQHIGWHGVFIFIAIFGFITAALAIAKLPKKSNFETAGKLVQSMDILGVLIFMLASFGICFGLNIISSGVAAYAIVVVGAVLLVAFIVHENRAKLPLVKPEIFKGGPNFALSNISALLSYAATFAVSYLLSIYLQQIKGFGADISGFILITSPAIQTFVTLFAGRLSDKYSPYMLASIGMGICTIGLGSLIFVGVETPLIQIFASLIILGFGFGIFSTPNTNAIMSMVKPPDYGIASSFVATMRNLGMVVSMAVITVIIENSLPGVPLAQAPVEDLALAMRIELIVFTVICLVGVFTSLSRRKAKDSK